MINPAQLQETAEMVLQKKLDKDSAFIHALESANILNALFDNSIDAILLTIAGGLIISANPAACEMFQMTAVEICAKGISGVADISDPRLKPLLAERRLTGKAKGELTFIRKDGSRFAGDLASAMFKDINGRETTSIFIRDITKGK